MYGTQLLLIDVKLICGFFLTITVSIYTAVVQAFVASSFTIYIPGVLNVNLGLIDVSPLPEL